MEETEVCLKWLWPPCYLRLKNKVQSWKHLGFIIALPPIRGVILASQETSISLCFLRFDVLNGNLDVKYLVYRVLFCHYFDGPIFIALKRVELCFSVSFFPILKCHFNSERVCKAWGFGDCPSTDKCEIVVGHGVRIKLSSGLELCPVFSLSFTWLQST